MAIHFEGRLDKFLNLFDQQPINMKPLKLIEGSAPLSGAGSSSNLSGPLWQDSCHPLLSPDWAA
jgi:hypothetical protein